ncbi:MULTISPECIES: heavy-metal-associated domain-containing protein [Streptomyces]|uniref:Regulator n=1 Tax=Streptomyces zinciresistens K42 TaxID=700597 RepID=G2G5V5_9ACTN|nr:MULTISPECIES: heavy-metal-associated domain-containing protein [Streptomyces]EGX61044.1 regulator [Streptomyces zinciresistens K42]MDT9696569.1 heavy-metal-associated domain-containing protein [Streptomyces sp. P17]
MPDVLTLEYRVSGMTCGHCENAVKQEVSAPKAVVHMQVDARTGRGTVPCTTPLDDPRAREAIDEAGYELTSRV